MRTSTSSSQKPSSQKPPKNAREDGEYQELVQQLRGAAAWPLFTTDATDLYATFLENLPAARRQHYECRACRKFVDRFGGLVSIDESGMPMPLLWGREGAAAAASSDFFGDAILALAERAIKARVTGVFLSSESTWGLAENASPKSPNSDGRWHHMHVQPTRVMIHRPGALLTSEQVAAEKLQDYGTLSRGLAEFSSALVQQAFTMLSTGALYRSEKCIEVAKWLLALHEARDATKHKIRKENLVWRAVALAPPGFCHVRSTMIGALLTDLEAGKPFNEIKASFDSKLSPIQYQRPTSAPTDGQLAAAEKVIEKLASAGALRRRYATLEDVDPHAIWLPKAIHAEIQDSIFGHLKAKKSSTIDIPAQSMTWDKFSWTVLQAAERVELLVPHVAGPYFAFVTASDPAAAPILQWDHEDRRNPVSWYLYHNGARPEWWGLTSGAYVDVTAITLQPSGWHQPREHQGDGAYFLLKGARDLYHTRAGLGLFPETLRAEYHGIRSAIEAFSKSRTLEGAEAASACGIALQKGSGAWGATFRVTTKGIRVSYKLDRFD